MARDSKLWEEAYKGYKKTSHYKKKKLSREDWLKAVGGPKIKVKNNHFKKVPFTGKYRPVSKEEWLRVTREFYAWKKTEDYQKWRKRQFGKQAGLCYYCDCSLIGVKTNVEHVRPRSLGGDNRKSNLVLACWKCNKDKSSTQLKYKVREELRTKHNSKKRALRDELELAQELKERLREE